MELRIRHDIYIHNKPEQDSEVVKILKELLNLNTKMAKNIADLSAKADELQTAQELKDIIAAGGSGA